tara:strand:- start:1770 stop:1982 length:213 start_codon:yes stop_codon:yes gene_type:complete
MSASSVRSKFMEVEKEKKRQRRLMKEGVQTPVQEIAPAVESVPVVEEVAPVTKSFVKKVTKKKAAAKKAK